LTLTDCKSIGLMKPEELSCVTCDPECNFA